MDRRSARLIDRGEIGLDHMRDDIAGMNTDPDLKAGIVEQLDAADQFDPGVAGHRRMVIVGMRRAEQRDQAVAALLADDAAVAPNRNAHGIEGRLEPRDRGLGIQFRDQVGRALQVGAEDGQVFPFTGDPQICLRFVQLMVRNDGTAGRTIEVASFQGR